jgi:NAD(P)-dependent dehydrogenase (short-subunit alcohol dehydrogenase family)
MSPDESSWEIPIWSERFGGRVAAVTGAASGIGRATAIRLAREGAKAAVIDRDGDGAEEVAREITAHGAAGRAYRCDIARGAEVAATADAITRDLGPIDVLANVAGTGDLAGPEGIEGLDNERWDLVMAVNINGAFYWCRAVLPGMAARGRGAIVTVSSLAGRSKSATGGLAYTTSKAALLGMTRHLAFDYGPRGVRVNAICPGGVDTPMLRAGSVSAARSEQEAEARVARLTAYSYFMPIKRLSTPDEQAAAIAFLASDDASYINGVSLDVNGGLFMA